MTVLAPRCMRQLFAVAMVSLTCAIMTATPAWTSGLSASETPGDQKPQLPGVSSDEPLLVGYTGGYVLNAPIYVMRAQEDERRKRASDTDGGRTEFIRYEYYDEAFAALNDRTIDVIAIMPVGTISSLVDQEADLSNYTIIGGALGKAPYYRVSVARLNQAPPPQGESKFGVAWHNRELDIYLKFKDAELNTSEVSEESLGGSADKMAALYYGKLDDAFVLSEIADVFTDNASRLLPLRDRVVTIRRRDFEDFPFAVMLASTAFVAEDEFGAVDKFLAAYRHAVEVIYDRTASDKVIDLIQRETQLPNKTIQSVMEVYIQQRVFETDAALECSDVIRHYGIDLDRSQQGIGRDGAMPVNASSCRHN